MSRTLRPKEATDLVNKSRKDAAKLAADSYKMCGIIYRLAIAMVTGKGGTAVPLFRERSFASWTDLVDSLCGIGASDARRMKAVWQFFEIDMKGKWNRQLALSSWRKMYLVSRMATQSNVNRLLNEASMKSVKEMEQEIRELISRLRDPSDPVVGSYNFHAVLFDRDKIENVMRAIEHIRQEHGTRSHGDAIFHMSIVYNESTQRRRRAA